MTNLRLPALGLVLIAMLGITSCGSKNTDHSIAPNVISRSRLSDGNLTRLQRALAKARRGDPVTLGFIGGSITRGEQATAKDRQYANRVTQWWIDRFPNTPITLVNAGISGTNSMYGCLRTQRDLISKHPDFVIVEYGVNDPDKDTQEKPYDAEEHSQTYEGVIRQLLADPYQPAIAELFMMHHDGSNAQKLQSEIGLHYGLPMISFRDAMWPEFTAGRLRQSDFFFDTVHPNDRGHAAIATFITSLLQSTLDHLPADASIPPVSSAVPRPIFTDLFEYSTLLDAANLHPVLNEGWTYDRTQNWWTSNSSGSIIEFDLTGQCIDMMYEKLNGGTATALVTVDGGMPLICSTWLNGWGPLTELDRVIISRTSQTHRVRIQLLMAKSPLNNANEFRVMGFGIANRGR